MSRIDQGLQRISRLPVDRQVGAYRNLHTLSLKSESRNHSGHERILRALLRAEHVVKGINEPLTVFMAVLELQGRHLRRNAVFASSLNNLANVLSDLRRFEEALAKHEEALVIRRAALPAGHPDVASSLNNLANVLSDLRRFEEALAKHEEALVIRRAALPAGHPLIADGLMDLANVLSDLRRFDEALSRHEESLAIKRDALPAGHPDIAISLNNLANVLSDLRRFDEALARCEEALVINQAALPAEHPNIADSLSTLANVLSDLRRFDEALAKHEEALEIKRVALSAGHPDIASSLSNLANRLYELQRFEEALAKHEEALAIYQTALPAGHPDLATSLNNLATVLSKLRRFDEALAKHEEALAIYRAVLPAGHPSIATSLNNLANTLSEIRHFDEALAKHEEALEIKRAALPVGHPDIASSLNNLATVLSDLRRFDEALTKYEEALEIKRDALPAGHPDIASGLNNLANVLSNLRRFEEALAKHEEALIINRAALPAGHPDIASGLNNLANTLYELHRFDKALTKYEEALAIRQAALPAGHPDIAGSLNNLGNVLTDLHRHSEAVQNYQQALEIQRDAFPEYHPYIARTLHHLASVLGELDQPGQGLPYATEAMNILLENEQFPQISKTLWGSPAEPDESVSETLALLLDLATRPKLEVPQLPGDVVTALLTYKGNTDIEQGLISILHANATGSFCDRLDQLQALQTEMARLQYSADLQDLLRTQEVTAQLQSLEQQIHTDPEGARLAEELQLRMITASVVQSALQDGEALLNLFVLGETVYAQVLHQNGPHHLHRYDVSDLKVQVAHLRFVLADTGILLHEAALLKPLQVLYTALITPIAGMLGLGADLKRLVISGDGFLYGLPWDLLCAPDVSRARPLVAELNTRLVPTPRDLVRLHHLQPLTSIDANPAVLLGVQSFGENMSTDVESTETDVVDLHSPPQLRSTPVSFATRSAVMTTGGSADLPRYGNLSGTEREIRTLTSLLTERGRSVSFHLSPDASEDKLFNIGLAPWVLHFSTHSDVWDAEQTRSLYHRAERLDPRYDPAHPFSRAVVLLDGYTHRNFQGVLRAWELGSLNLRGTELVTFSSCNSGLGDMTAGRGVAGLSQAAFLAGAQRTITTLWPVLDATTPEWMENVYTARLDGASWQDAVRDEKLRMLGDEQPVSAWAPFVLNGLA